MKICIRCRKSKPESEFYAYNRSQYPDRIYLTTTCKPCCTARSREWRKNHRDESRRRDNLKKKKRRYKKIGTTIDYYEFLRLAQDNKCAVCGIKPDHLCLDHNHKTGC